MQCAPVKEEKGSQQTFANSVDMTKTIIFDLSEVLIAGLVGIEYALSERLGVQPETILPEFGNKSFINLLCGRLSEDSYLQEVRSLAGWDITLYELKQIIRQNFHRKVEGMDSILQSLAEHYEMVLLSDHAKEWAEYIQTIHPILDMFDKQFFSFQLGKTKKHPSLFMMVLELLEREAEECMFIDDMQDNVERALSVGMRAIHFTTAEQLVKDLEKAGILI